MEAITREEKLLDGQDLEPITRKEMFIKRIYDKTQYIPEPITREEMFLKKAGESGGDITIEQLTVTENGEYSEQGVAYSPVIVNVPTPPSYLVKDVPNLPQAVASFDDAIVAPIIKLKASIEPVQDLHGYDAPWVGGSGKNKLPKGETKTSTDITFTVKDDGQVVVTGTATSTRFWGVKFTIPAGSYTYNGCPSGGSFSTYQMDIRDAVGGTGISGIGGDTGTGSTFTIAEPLTAYVNIRIANGYACPSGGLTFKPMIRLSSVTDATFEPYENICPISGWDGANVWVQAVVDTTAEADYSISWQTQCGTVYGGNFKVFKDGGKWYITVNSCPYFASYNGETLVGEWISDRDVYAVGTTPTIGAQVVNIGGEVTTTTFEIDTEIATLLGNNNIFADCGDVTECRYITEII